MASSADDPTNLPPEMIKQFDNLYSIDDGQTLTLDLNNYYKDPEGAPLTFRDRFGHLIDNGLLNLSGVHLLPQTDPHLVDMDVLFTVSDGVNTVEDDNIVYNVFPVADAVVAANAALETTAGHSVSFDPSLLAGYPDGKTLIDGTPIYHLTVTADAPAAGQGTIAVGNDGIITYTPDAAFDTLQPGQVETVQFTYEIASDEYTILAPDPNGPGELYRPAGTTEATVMVAVSGVRALHNADLVPGDPLPSGAVDISAATTQFLLSNSDPSGTPYFVYVAGDTPLNGNKVSFFFNRDASYEGFEIHGGAGDNAIYGGANGGTILAGAGNDIVEGGGHTKKVDAGTGDDAVRLIVPGLALGGAGNDYSRVRTATTRCRAAMAPTL